MLKILWRIVQDVNAANDLQEALDIVVHSVRDVVNTDACSIYLMDKTGQNYHLMASVGFKTDAIGKVKLKIDQGLVGLVAKREEPINVEHAQLHPNYAYFPETGEERYQAFMGAPIIHQKRVLGVLVIQQCEHRKFDEGEVSFLMTICAQLASTIAHAEVTGAIANLSESGYSEVKAISPSEDVTIVGLPCSPGVAIGKAVTVYPLADIDAVPNRKIENIEEELNDFHEALKAAQNELKELSQRMSTILPKEEVAIFDAYIHMLDDTSLGGEVCALIQEGVWAQSALKKVIKKHVRMFEEMDDEYLKERALDVKDLGRRVLSHLQANAHKSIKYQENTILVGEEISASRLAEVPEGWLAGIISTKGSRNSHVAILARSMGLPVVMGAEGVSLDSINNKEVVVDGYNGRIYVSPKRALKDEFQRLILEEQELYQGLKALKDKPALTPDGHRIKLMVNTGLLADAPSSLEVGAEGVGLYRTEIPFLIRDNFPTEEEQSNIYQSILSAYAPNPVIMRTLDVGGDKNLPYFPVEETNPFLGWRGIRITLDHPELFLVQIRAMLRASYKLGNLRILLPMVSSLGEVIEATTFIKQACDELCEEGIKVSMPKVGVMVEVPSIIYQIPKIAQHIDFLSIGTNDLTQYLLAVDRNNSRVAGLYESLHPAVLQALMHIVKQAKACGLEISLCGEMASDPVAAVLLLAMGMDSLSMNPTSLAPVKWVMRSISLQQAEQLLQDALTMDDPLEIRKHVEKTIDQAGLGGLIRAGK